MNLFLMPLWFLSGALFPPENAWGGLRWLMQLNPHQLWFGRFVAGDVSRDGFPAGLRALPSWG